MSEPFRPDVEALQETAKWEAQVRTAARAFHYPPTPDLTPAVTRQLGTRRASRSVPPRFAWIATVLIVLLAGLMAVPQVRAAVLDVLRLGNVRIFLREPAATPAITSQSPTAIVTTRATRRPTSSPTLSTSPLDLMGETTLDLVQQTAPFALRAPRYPADLGPADHVFLQELGNGVAVVLVWVEPNEPTRVRLALQQLGPGAFVDKLAPEVIEETRVNGRRAVWAAGPYLLRQKNGEYDEMRLVTGNTLIWEEGDVTYRLESRLPLAEAIKVAESLQPVP